MEYSAEAIAAVLNLYFTQGKGSVCGGYDKSYFEPSANFKDVTILEYMRAAYVAARSTITASKSTGSSTDASGKLILSDDLAARELIWRKIAHPAVLMYITTAASAARANNKKSDASIPVNLVATNPKQTGDLHVNLLREIFMDCNELVTHKAAYLALATAYGMFADNRILQYSSFAFVGAALNAIPNEGAGGLDATDMMFSRARMIHDILKVGDPDDIGRLTLNHLEGMDKAWLCTDIDNSQTRIALNKRFIVGDDKPTNGNYISLRDYCLLESVLLTAGGNVNTNPILRIAQGNKDIFAKMLQIGGSSFQGQCGKIILGHLRELLKKGDADKARGLVRNLPPEVFQKWGASETAAEAEQKEAEADLIELLFTKCTAEQLQAIDLEWWNRKIVSGYDDPALLPRWQSKGVRNAYKKIPADNVGALVCDNAEDGSPIYSCLYLLFGVLQFGSAEQLSAMTTKQLDCMSTRNVLNVAVSGGATFGSVLRKIGTTVVIGNGSQDNAGDRWRDPKNGKIFPQMFGETVANLLPDCELLRRSSCASDCFCDFWQFITADQATNDAHGLLRNADVRERLFASLNASDFAQLPVYPLGGDEDIQKSYGDCYVARNCLLMHALFKSCAADRKVTIPQRILLLNWVAKKWKEDKRPCDGKMWANFGFEAGAAINEDDVLAFLVLANITMYPEACSDLLEHHASGEEPKLDQEVANAVAMIALMSPKFMAHDAPGFFIARSEEVAHRGLIEQQILDIGAKVIVGNNPVDDKFQLRNILDKRGVFTRKDYLIALFHGGSNVTPVLRKLLDHLRSLKREKTAEEKEVRGAVLLKMFMAGGECRGALTSDEYAEVQNGITRDHGKFSAWELNPTKCHNISSLTREDFEKYFHNNQLNPPPPPPVPEEIASGILRLDEPLRHAILRHVFCRQADYFGGRVKDLNAFGAERLVELLNCSKFEGRVDAGKKRYPDLRGFDVKKTATSRD
ncbi:MAG: hypothetical protein LBH53_02195, partial [Puniceicoccales bacterium]|nr:hypothetical protein [Puniceicoccales bacterium]